MTVLRTEWNRALANDGKIDRQERKDILAKVKAAGEVCSTEIKDIFEESDRAMDAANASGKWSAIQTAAETRGSAMLLQDDLREACHPRTFWQKVWDFVIADLWH